jgi:hypothetical protein
MVGSISKNKVVVILLSTFCTLISCIPTSLLAGLQHLFKGGPSTDRSKVWEYVSYLYIFVTVYYYTALLNFIATKEGFDLCSKNPEIMISRNLESNPHLLCVHYINDYLMSFSVLCLLACGTPFICCLVAVFLLGNLLKLRVRMKLQE